MKQSLNQDTLAYQLGMRPALQHRDMSALPLKLSVEAVKALQKSSSIYASLTAPVSWNESPMGYPEKDAIIFYMLNHAVSLIRQKVHVYEPLEKYLPIVERYHVELAVRAQRMFGYLLLICTRESRHDKQPKSGSNYMALTKKYGVEVTNFHTSLIGSGSSGAVDKLQASPPVTTIGKYTAFLSDVFHTGHYGNGYGGKAWGKVADVLRDFVAGKITAEMMQDTAFTLCHNNGPIFNKGMLFHDFTSEIYKILDVQRSGQIPQLICDKATPLAKDHDVVNMWADCAAVLPDEFSGYVDWYKVEELGALHTYSQQQQQQVAKHGYPSKFKAKKEAEAAKAEVLAKAKLVALKSKVEIIPGQFITKIARSV